MIMIIILIKVLIIENIYIITKIKSLWVLSKHERNIL